jgi:predicted PurR-regulated permease PerM
MGTGGMQMIKSWMKVIVVAILACLGIKYSDKIFAMAAVALGTLKPLLYGAVIAYILNILMKRLEKLYFPRSQKQWVAKTRRPVCVFASIFLVLFIAVFLVVLVIPALGKSVYVLTKDIPTAFTRFQNWLSELAAQAGFSTVQEYLDNLNINWNDLYGKIGSVLQRGIGNIFTSAFSAANLVASFFITGAVAVIFSIYMLFEKETLGRQFGKLTSAYFPQKHREQIQELINLANESFTNYITGQVLEAFILGLLCGLGMFLLRLPYALMVGAIVGVTALIPVMGCYIGAITGAFLIVTVSPTKALVFLIFLVILQQVEGNLIYPRVVGGSIGLPGIWVLASVTVGGGLFGIPGMLIGVPLAATIYKWLQRDVRRRLSGSEQSSPQAETSASETAGM